MKIQTFEKKILFFKIISVSDFMNIQEDPRNNKSIKSGINFGYKFYQKLLE